MKREDWRAALMACAVYNVHRGKDDPAITPEKLLPWLRTDESSSGAGSAGERRQTPEEMRALLEQITLEMGGIVHPRNRPLA